MSVEGAVPSTRSSQRAGLAAAAGIVAFVVAAAAFAAGWLVGGRRTAVVADAPSGGATAFITEARCGAGICQSLWVGASADAAQRVQTLAGPSETAGEIAWTPDGSRVGFLINGFQLRVFDAHSGTNLGAINLIEPDASPSTRIARGVTFSANGAAVTFDDCPRTHSGCRPAMAAIK